MIDWTPVVLGVVAGCFAVAKIVLEAQINSRMKDANAAATLNKALDNSLGALAQAAEAGIRSHPLQLQSGGVLCVSGPMAAGIQYVLDHAGPEMDRLNITPELVADKINARIGLGKIAAATAAGGDPVSPLLTARPPAAVDKPPAG